MRALMKTVLAAAGLAAVLTAGAAAGGEGSASIEKFFRVDERVATGAQPTPAQLGVLKDEGFRTVINLREPAEFDAAAEEATAKDLGLKYVVIPVNSADPKPAEADAFLASLDDTAIYPVFIHCGTGNRVGAFWMIRRVLVDRWTLECAENEARQIGLKSSNLRLFAVEYIAAHEKKGAEKPCSNGS